MILVAIGYVMIVGFMGLDIYHPSVLSVVVSTFYLRKRCGEMVENEFEKLERFKEWCETRFVNIDGHKRMSLNDFDKIITDSYNELHNIADKPDHLSFACGVVSGMKLLLSPDNE